MMEDDMDIYDSINTPDQKDSNQKGSHDNRMYMIPLKPCQEKKSEYEQPIVSVLSLPRMKLPLHEGATGQQQNKNNHIELNEGIQCDVTKKKKKPLRFIIICVFMTVFTVVTLVALAIGALSYYSVQQGGYSNSQFGRGAMSGAFFEESLNYTHFINEISALNTFVGQLNSNAKMNFSQLIAQFNFALTDGNDSFLQFSNQLMMIQNDVSSVIARQSNLRSDISAAQTNIASVSSQLNTAQGNITSVRNTVKSFISTDIRSISSVNQGLQSLISTNIPSSVGDQISRSASDLNTRINSVSGSLSIQIYAASTLLTRKIFSTSRSLNQQISSTNFTLSSRISSVASGITNRYRSCYEINRTCLIDDFLPNNNKRLYCTTGRLSINISNYYTVDMRCEIVGDNIGNSYVEATSLQRESTSTSVSCQCSILFPSSSGVLLAVTTSSPPLTCTLRARRCQ